MMFFDTLWTWDDQYIQEHCDIDFNSIFTELHEQAQVFNYSIGFDDLEKEAERIYRQWEATLDSPDAEAIYIPGFGKELI